MSIGAGSCANDDTGASLGSVLHPDAQGVLTDVAPDFSSLVLDEGPERPLADSFRAFSAVDLTATQLMGRVGQYVQIGLDDGEVAWLAAVGAVLGGNDPVALFSGMLADVDEDQATFQNGIVLRVLPAVDLGAIGDLVTVEIDVDRDAIRAVLGPRR